MILAILCILHCLLFPVLVALLPATRVVFNSIILEISILFFGILIGSISFITSFKKHRKPGPLALGFTGVLFLGIDLFVLSGDKGHIDFHGLSDIHPLMIAGGLALIAGHAWNLHACHCFCDKACSHEEHHTH